MEKAFGFLKGGECFFVPPELSKNIYFERLDRQKKNSVVGKGVNAVLHPLNSRKAFYFLKERVYKAL